MYESCQQSHTYMPTFSGPFPLDWYHGNSTWVGGGGGWTPRRTLSDTHISGRGRARGGGGGGGDIYSRSYAAGGL